MIAYHSSIGVAAWTDLRRSLKDRSVSELRGSIQRKQRNGKTFLYDHYRLGGKTVDRYIGLETPELLERIGRAEAIREREHEAQKQRARWMRVLRAEGFLMTDAATGQLLTAMARTGVFRLGGTLVGTHAFRAYEGELGIRIQATETVQTQDIDIASFERLSLAIGETISDELAAVFRDFDFDPVPSLEPGQTWRWRQATRETEIEFLTPSFDDQEGLRPLEALGVKAQSLHHLNYLIADAIDVPVLYRAGILAQVPRPERFAIHKLIVADRRRQGNDPQKAAKDRMQAALLIEALAQDRPQDLEYAWAEAMGKGPKWRKRIQASLARMPATRDRLTQLGLAPH